MFDSEVQYHLKSITKFDQPVSDYNFSYFKIT